MTPIARMGKLCTGRLLLVPGLGTRTGLVFQTLEVYGSFFPGLGSQNGPVSQALETGGYPTRENVIEQSGLEMQKAIYSQIPQ